MARTSNGRVETGSLAWLHRLAIVLVLATGVVHLYAGAVEGRAPVALAGAGFLLAVGLFLADYRRPLLYLVGAFYTAVQLPLWYVAKAGEYTTLGYADKAIQVALIVLLAYLYWRQRGEPSPGTETVAA